MPRTRMSLLAMIACAGLPVGLAACQETGGGLAAGAPASARIEAPGVPIAIESIEGAPEGVKGKLASALAGEAAVRRIALTTSGEARYRVRGYVATYRGDGGGTVLAYVWDVFDASDKRARRIEGTSLARADAKGDPWASIDADALQQAASTGMNEIAAFLVTLDAAPVSNVTAANGGRPLGFTRP